MRRPTIHFALQLLRCAVSLPFLVASPVAIAQSITTLALGSSAIHAGQPIPAAFTCDGQNDSPPLNWRNVPRNTKSLALTLEDPDAPDGDFVHWIVYAIPATAHGLSAGMPALPKWPDGSEQGKNSAATIGYFGPCPPSGTHRYLFRLYALDIKPALLPGATLARLQQVMKGHVIGRVQLLSVYARPHRGFSIF